MQFYNDFDLKNIDIASIDISENIFKYKMITENFKIKKADSE